MTDFITRVNDAVARTVVGRWFKLEGSGAKKERAGARFFVRFRLLVFDHKRLKVEFYRLKSGLV
jgi:hypothetical protein